MLCNFRSKSHIYSDLRSPSGLEQWRYLSFSLEFILFSFFATHTIHKMTNALAVFFYISSISHSLGFRKFLKATYKFKVLTLKLGYSKISFSFFFSFWHFTNNIAIAIYTLWLTDLFRYIHRSPQPRTPTRNSSKKRAKLEKRRMSAKVDMRRQKDGLHCDCTRLAYRQESSDYFWPRRDSSCMMWSW